MYIDFCLKHLGRSDNRTCSGRTTPRFKSHCDSSDKHGLYEEEEEEEDGRHTSDVLLLTCPHFTRQQEMKPRWDPQVFHTSLYNLCGRHATYSSAPTHRVMISEPQTESVCFLKISAGSVGTSSIQYEPLKLQSNVKPLYSVTVTPAAQQLLTASSPTLCEFITHDPSQTERVKRRSEEKQKS